jgi:hypothetical protein
LVDYWGLAHKDFPFLERYYSIGMEEWATIKAIEGHSAKVLTEQGA